jgi:hypothetical protein
MPIDSTKTLDGVVSIATGYEVRVRVSVGSRIFSTLARPALGSTRPPIQWAPWALSPGVKRQGHEAPVGLITEL